MKHLIITGLIALLSAAASLHATTATELKFPAGTATVSGTNQGVAIGETYIVVGIASASYALKPGGPVISNAGEIQVFSASTGAFIRRIRPAAPMAGDQYGKTLCVQGSRAFVVATSTSLNAVDLTTGKTLWRYSTRENSFSTPYPINQAFMKSVAVDGDTVLIGLPEAWTLNDPVQHLYLQMGIVDRISASTGLSTGGFTATDAQQLGAFGTAVAISGRMTAIGEPMHDYGADSNCGEVILRWSDTHGLRLAAPSPTASDRFGTSVAFAGDRLLVGCPGRDEPGRGNVGKVFLYDTTTGAYIKEVSAPASLGAGAEFGTSLSASGSLATIYSGGACWLYDVAADQLTQMLPLSGAPVSSGYGLSASIHGSRAVVADAYVSGSSASYGRVHRFTSIGRAWPAGSLIATTKKAAPGTPTGTNFYTFGDTSVSPQGKVMFTGTVSGGGTTTASNSALWSNLSGPLELITRENDNFGVRKLSVPTKPLFNPEGKGLFLDRFTGGALEQNLFFDDGIVAFRTMGENSAISVNGTQETIGKIHEVVNCTQAAGQGVLAYSAKVGLSGITTLNDSRIGLRTNSMLADEAREGQPSPVAGFNYGQITPRVASNASRVTFVAALTGAPATSNSALIIKGLGLNNAAVVARKGDVAPGAGTAKFSTFISETLNATDVIFRATLTGGASGVTSGIWRHFPTQFPVGTALVPVAIRMQQAAGLATGVKFTTFFNTYIADGGAIMFRAQVAGPGINTSNDVGLWLYSQGALHLILREGDALPGTGGLRVGTIQRFDLGGSSHYAALVTLAGASTASNQAILTGSFTSLTQATWAPVLAVRKGTNIDRPLSMPITSLGMAANHLDVTGAGSKGTAEQVCASGVVFSAQFADAKDLVMGKP